MKRVKRLFACLLALTMMLGLSATAFATETAEKVQTPANGGTVTFEKENKNVLGRERIVQKNSLNYMLPLPR